MKNKNSDIFLATLTRLAMKTAPLTDNEITVIREGYVTINQNNVYLFAKNKKVLPFIANVLINLNLDKDYWKEIYNNYEKRNTKIIEILDKVFTKLKSAETSKAFVYENFGALLASDTSIGCFASGDVDLYADISIKNMITDILNSEGFIPKYRNYLTKKIKTEFFNTTLFETGFGINVMWKPLSRIKLPFPLIIDNCVKWNKLSTYKNTTIQLPGKDTLMYLCLLHISIHSYNRSPDIRLYTDTCRVSLANPDWKRIADFARQDNTEVRTATAAILSHKLLGMPLPAEWIKTYPGKFRQINHLLKLVYDTENNCLKNEPNGISVLLIEILSSDSHWMKAILKILFPPEEWIKEYYLQGKGSILKGYLMHLKNLI